MSRNYPRGFEMPASMVASVRLSFAGTGLRPEVVAARYCSFPSASSRLWGDDA